jgi:uncharacterized flavoprotein (TIGR03862 family)
MKASPLLRAWMGRLGGLGVGMRLRHRWTGWEDGGLGFETPRGGVVLRPAVTVLALGGASWARLGADGAWAPLLAARGVGVAPFAPANAGLRVDWSAAMARHFGAPVKAVAFCAGSQRVRAECVVSARGLEGGGIYAVSRAVREGATLTLDLAPDRSEAALAGRLAAPRGKDSAANYLRKRLGLGPVKTALLMEFGRPLPGGAALARLVKALPVRHGGLRPMDEAISTAGGVRWEAVDAGLMLKALPGVFVAGEMLDWEAPTGGYLLTGCLSTGRWAGRAAAAWTPGRDARGEDGARGPSAPSRSPEGI